MGSVDDADDRTFKVNFSSDGAVNLKEQVKDKLKQFMGDYTDDTLVEYVIVLLRNGRCKEEAQNELNVFLGDDSCAFVSWLWDHLALNLNRYVQKQDSITTEVSKTKSAPRSVGGKSDLNHVDSEFDRGKTNSELARSRHCRGWKGIGRGADEGSTLRSSNVKEVHVDKEDQERIGHEKQSRSPRTSRHRKRNWHDEQHHTKEEVSKATSNAPRRLLQFAVRDAVSIKKPVSDSTSGPSSKRLRSVVSTSIGETSSVHPRKIQSEARIPNSLQTAIKAVAEAAEDVTKVRSSGSVFDRLGRGADAARTRDGLEEVPEKTGATPFQRSNYDGDGIQDMVSLEDETELDSDDVLVEGYGNDVDVMGNRAAGPYQTSRSVESYSKNLMSFQHGVVMGTTDVSQSKWTKHQSQSGSTARNATNTLLKTSMNESIFKQQYVETPNGMQFAHHKSVCDSKAGGNDSGLRLLKAQQGTDNKKEPQKVGSSISVAGAGSYAGAAGSGSSPPSEDADSRTIFVSNVHFAASKDDISRHFNKSGDVLKVVILTDATTGQPKGAAYVEFTRKEAADDALSMDGTSFMSRILKVVKKSSAQLEAGAMTLWSRGTRASPYPVSRFRYPFPRGVPGTFRARPPNKAGSRSFQWKRDAQSTPADIGGPVSGSSIPAPGRSLTYVRTEAKPNGN